MKNNTIGIITLIIIVALVGGAIGFAISFGIVSNNNNLVQQSEPAPQPNEAKNVQQPQTQNVVATTTTAESTTTATSTNTTTEKVQYDGSQNIIVNGKSYTVGYKEEPYTNENGVKMIYLTFYLNNRKINTLDIFDNADDVENAGSPNYKIQLHQFCNDYILVEVEHYTPSFRLEDFCIVNTDGQHIGTLSWNGGYGITLKETKKSLTYELNPDSFILYKQEPVSGGEGAIKYKYTVSNDVLTERIVDTYNSEQVYLSGK